VLLPVSIVLERYRSHQFPSQDTRGSHEEQEKENANSVIKGRLIVVESVGVGIGVGELVKRSVEGTSMDIETSVDISVKGRSTCRITDRNICRYFHWRWKDSETRVDNSMCKIVGEGVGASVDIGVGASVVQRGVQWIQLYYSVDY
jgi:hypothetical protein